MGHVLHLGDKLTGLAVVGNPLPVQRSFVVAEPAADGRAADLYGPLPVGTVPRWRVGPAVAVGVGATGVAADQATAVDGPDVSELLRERAVAALAGGEAAGGVAGDRHGSSGSSGAP